MNPDDASIVYRTTESWGAHPWSPTEFDPLAAWSEKPTETILGIRSDICEIPVARLTWKSIQNSQHWKNSYALNLADMVLPVQVWLTNPAACPSKSSRRPLLELQFKSQGDRRNLFSFGQPPQVCITKLPFRPIVRRPGATLVPGVERLDGMEV